MRIGKKNLRKPQVFAPPPIDFVRVRGNCIPVKEKFRALGCDWDAANKHWLVPTDKQAEALALMLVGEDEEVLPYLDAKGRSHFKEEYHNGIKG